MTPALVGHAALPISTHKPFLEGEACFNPKASSTQDMEQVRESKLKPSSSPGVKMSNCHGGIQSRRGLGLPTS